MASTTTDDTDRLRGRLRAALLGPLLGAAALGGCAGPQEPPRQELPGCPSGTWCGDAEAAAGIAQGSEGELGCAKQLQWNAASDGGKPVPSDLPPYGSASLDGDATRKQREAGKAAACCYRWVEPCPGGRPFLAPDGRAVVADVVPGPAWGGAQDLGLAPAAAEADVVAALAAAWLDDARMEHASIASFARTTLELLALGAPPELVAGCQRAALDEVRHAERGFAIASLYAGRALGPGPLTALPPRPADPVRLARDTFLEGCVGETIAALAAARAATGSADPALRAVLTEIAADEEEHAALAWATLGWLVREDPSVAPAVREAAAALRDAEASSPPAAAAAVPAAELARHGRLDGEAQRATRNDAWARIIEPLLADVLAAV